jgi:transposase InsO family protein
MRILQLRAARGWTLEKTVRIFLVDLQTLQIWMRRIDEHGERDLIQTVEPVNRYPDFVRNLVRQLKRLFPEIGNERMAQVLARAGLHLGATTIRRMVRERGGPPEDEPQTERRRRRVVARYPGHTWHVDLTTVPTRAGFWVPWFPFTLPQSWPFCWWVAVAIDQLSRVCVGFAVFAKYPSSVEVQRFLDRAARTHGKHPCYVVTDKGRQFWCRISRRGASVGTSGLMNPQNTVTSSLSTRWQTTIWPVLGDPSGGVALRLFTTSAKVQGENRLAPHADRESNPDRICTILKSSGYISASRDEPRRRWPCRRPRLPRQSESVHLRLPEPGLDEFRNRKSFES